MTEGNKDSKPKKVMTNIVYSILVFFGVSGIGVAILDPAAVNNDESELSAKVLFAMSIGIVTSVVFSIWYAKRISRNP